MRAAAPRVTPKLEMLGYGEAHVRRERDVEQRFDAQLSSAELREWLKSMSSEPNQVGSPHDKANAEFMLQKFRDWGWDAQIETFNVLYPTPKHESRCSWSRRARSPRGCRSRRSRAMPTSGAHAGSCRPTTSMAPTAMSPRELVYVNYGMPDDYKELERRGISVQGKIVIARYGGGWRGLKPKLAHEHGAIGCLIYSDPRR